MFIDFVSFFVDLIPVAITDIIILLPIFGITYLLISIFESGLVAERIRSIGSLIFSNVIDSSPAVILINKPFEFFNLSELIIELFKTVLAASTGLLFFPTEIPFYR